MNDSILIESGITAARRAELGVDGWPLWKDGIGSRALTLDASEKSYFLAGEAVLTLEDGEPVNARQGDLVIIPAGTCRWDVKADVRRHYRSDALSPACCII
ncbi:MAG: cupin domain-containing protein [Pseudomonadota bacterium]|nr:cupin domain-containing protein [Pseudomonadota bacterium]MDP1905411.1 cupin domain-containing protein [Pseudomonadota bacterium]MDP2354133.1 cupin domain-containing protein [Pseudomonadota bacterium]